MGKKMNEHFGQHPPPTHIMESKTNKKSEKEPFSSSRFWNPRCVEVDANTHFNFHEISNRWPGRVMKELSGSFIGFWMSYTARCVSWDTLVLLDSHMSSVVQERSCLWLGLMFRGWIRWPLWSSAYGPWFSCLVLWALTTAQPLSLPCLPCLPGDTDILLISKQYLLDKTFIRSDI